MNDAHLKLLERALAFTPEDWETRLYLAEQFASHDLVRARNLIETAPNAPGSEIFLLRMAKLEILYDFPAALTTLQLVLQTNKGCAEAYWLMARVYQKQGLKAEARKKYGAATVIDESLADPEMEAWLEEKPSSHARQKSPNIGTTDTNEITQEEIRAALKELDSGSTDSIPRIGFKDIGGMEPIIQRIQMNIIYPFKNPSVFEKFGKKPGGGILLYGPPGCGKTHIARATAGECGATFMTLAITDILSKWMGESERQLHQIFESARKQVPAVLFIDEVDAIGVNRSDAGSLMAPLVNVFLTEMDGIRGVNDNLMILAATNMPWRVDNALRRPGRFDRVLFVPPPDAAARRAILEICLRDLPVDALDLDGLVCMTNLFSGADLRGVVQRAAEHAILEEMHSKHPSKITQKFLVDAIRKSKPSTLEWLETARSYATYSNKSGLYDDLAEYFELN